MPFGQLDGMCRFLNRTNSNLAVAGLQNEVTMHFSRSDDEFVCDTGKLKHLGASVRSFKRKDCVISIKSGTLRTRVYLLSQKKKKPQTGRYNI